MRYSIALTTVLAGLGLASDVLDLNKDTLKGFVEENDLALIECEFLHLIETFTSSSELIQLQSSLRGAVTARRLRPSTRRRLQP
jgi:hypothetical protein